jgi:3-oxoacyl-[acyl-carrier protein] reductase
VDISDESAVKRMYAVAQEHFHSVDILVHCAAMFPKYALLDVTVEQWDRIQAVNLRGTMLVMREAIRNMRAGGKGGAIVNISSVSGEREVVFHNAAYGASKNSVVTTSGSMPYCPVGPRRRVPGRRPRG